MARTCITSDDGSLTINGSVISPTLIQLVRVFMECDRKVHAIKLVRYDTNLGLAEAKDFVDFLYDVRDGQTRMYSHTTEARDLASKNLHY
jgi:hypothetical protein